MAKAKLGDIFPGNYRISQYFGQNSSYYKKFGLNGHEGVDWACPIGVKMLNPFDAGIVLRTGWDAIYGYYVVIWDAKQRVAAWFCHLSRIYVAPGQQVKLGFVLGLSGSTGNVSGPHLHFGFVTTDAYGNRLDRNNGYQGFKNVLDSRLVYWVIRALKKTFGFKDQPLDANGKPMNKAEKPIERRMSAKAVMEKDLKKAKSVFKKK